MVRFSSVRFLLAFAVQNDMLIHQMDEQLSSTVNSMKKSTCSKEYLKPGEEHLVCKLEKSLCRWKQSRRCWNKALQKYLEKIGYTQATEDPCVFIQKNDKLLIIAVHVDDMMILAENCLEMRKIKDSIKWQFKMKDMGELHFYVGLSVVQDKENKQVYLH